MGKGGGGPSQTTSTSYQTNVPEYARPYVETMLGATQQQLFNTTPTYDESGAQTGTEITGFQPYKPYSTDPSQYVAPFSPLQQQYFQGTAGLQVPGQFGAATGATAEATQRALQTGYRPGYFESQYQAPGQYAPGQFSMLQAQAPELQMYQMGAPERVRTGAFTQPGTAEAYMSPYIQQALAPQLAEIQRQSDIAQQGLRGQATAAGAFGGTRQALQASEQERNKQALMSQAVGQGYQGAYQQAMQQYSTDAARRLQAQLANQQAGLTAGQSNLQAALGIQQLGAGQNLQAQLANQQALQAAQQAAEQSRQYGYGQGMTSAQLAAQYGQAAQQATEQSRQYGAGYGLQGLQTGLQGAAQLGTLGQQQLAAQQGILGAQQQAGALQQAQQQSIINQAIQDYATAQQYPLMQLGFMSNMIRGLPMQATTTQQYQATPSPYSQAVGAIGTLGSALRGGQPTSGFAKGGIASIGYDVGGEIKSKLYDMDIEDLRREAKSSNSPSIRQMAANILREKMQTPQSLAGGGIVAFAQPTDENNQSLVRVPREDLGLLETGDINPIAPPELRVKEIDPRFARGWGITPKEAPAPVADARGAIERAFDALPENKSGDKIDPVTKQPISFGQFMRLQDERSAREAAAKLSPTGSTFTESVNLNRLPTSMVAQAIDRVAPTAPVAPAAAPRPAPGITAAAPAAPAPATPAAPATPRPAAAAPAASSGLMSFQDFMRGIPAEMKPPPEESTEDYIRRRQAYAGPDEDRQARRRQLMSERANVEDEARRRRDERLGQFFASWGTTPGPFLVAGMESYKKFAENNIADREVRAKMLREIDKSIHELNAAARAEKLGDFDGAESHKMKGREIAQRANSNLLSTYGQVTQAQATLAGVRERAAATARDISTGDYGHALKQLELVQRDIEAERGKAGTPYARAASLYEAFMRQAPGGDINKLEPKMREQALSAKAVIDARHAADEKRLLPYRENVDRAAQAAGYTSVTPVTPRATEAEKVTVGDKTYTRPTNFTDEQWNNYKKAVGAK